MDAREQFEKFRERRTRAVLEPRGNLALVSTNWIDSPQEVWGVPGRWEPLPPGESGLKLTATAGEGIRLDGELVDSKVVVRGKDSESPGELEFSSTVSGFVIAGEGGRYALRVWDSESEAVQNFGRIDFYPYNPEWVVEAQFSEKPGMTLPFEHSKDEGKTRELEVPGEVSFTKDGAEYSLAAISSGKALQIVYSDSTSGVDTYGVGRFLFVLPDKSGRVTLDFNLGVLPPCAFSYAFNCPMPPKQNRFTVPIEAGEKNVLARSGELLH